MIELFTRQFELRNVAADGRTLEGYAAVFNQRTEINDQQGHYTEEVMPGAFKRSLQRSSPIIQYNHGSHPMIGDIPIATPERFAEDKNGLYIRGRLIESPITEHLRAAIADGAITGMSFRFGVVRDKRIPARSRDELPHRQLIEVRLHEVSVTPFPAYAGTSVALRSLIESWSDDDLREILAVAHSRGIMNETGTSDSSTVSEELESELAKDPNSTRRRVTRDELRRSAAFILMGVQNEPSGAAA